MTRTTAPHLYVGILAAAVAVTAPGIAAARNPLDPFHTGTRTLALAAPAAPQPAGGAAGAPPRPASPSGAAPASQPAGRATGAPPPRPAATPKAPSSQPVSANRPPPGAVPTSQPAAGGPAIPGASPATPKTPASQPATPGEGSPCSTEDDCPAETYCEASVCVPLRLRLNVLYLYYRSPGRTFTEAGGIYWHQRGKSGYRVVAPFYWHFWRPQKRFRAVAPFYWHASDDTVGAATTVVPPFQWGKAPGERYFRLWPLVFWADYGKAGSSFTLIPLFHRARRASYSAFAFPLGFYASDTKTRTSTGQALLYYWHRSPTHRADALWPLFYAGRSRPKAFTWVAPLNFYWRRKDASHFIGFPLAYYSGTKKSALTIVAAPPIIYYRQRRYTFTTVLPLFYRFGTPEKSRTWLLPLFFAGNTGTAKHAVVFPILWHFSRPGTHTTVFANTWYRRHPQGYSAGVLPLFFAGEDRKQGVSHVTLLPIFHYSTSAHGRRRFVLTPLAIHGSDQDARTSYTFVPLPPYYHRRDPTRELDVLFPLYLRHRSRETGSTVQAITPLLWLHTDAKNSTQVFFPLVWRFTAKRERVTASAVLPLFFRLSAPERSTTVVGPAFFHRDRTGWDTGIAPLLFAGASKERRYGVIFPWLWHFASASSSTTIAAPFYYHRSRDGWLSGLAPLVFAGNRRGTRHLVLFPLVWHFSNEHKGYRATVVGPFFHARRRHGYQAGLAPVLFFGRDRHREHQIVAPLFWRFYDRQADDETIIVGPAFRRLKGTRHREYGLLPLFHYRRTPTSQSLTIVPLLHHSQHGGRRLWVTPLGGHLIDVAKTRETLVVGPFIRHRTPAVDAWITLPLFGHWRELPTKTTTTLLLPFGVYRRSPTETQGVAFPFVWYFRNPKKTNLTVFPFYTRTRSGELNADVVIPLIWSFRSPQRRTLVVGPAYHTRGIKAKSLDFGVLPLFAYSRTPKRSIFAALPGVYMSHWYKAQRQVQVFGPVVRATFRDGWAGGLVPLMFFQSRGPVRRALVVPLLWHSANDEEQTSLTVAGLYLYHRHRTARTYGLMPFFFLRTWPDATSVTIFPALHVSNSPERIRLLSPAAGGTWGKGVNPSWGYIGPFWWLRKQHYSADGLLPLVWRFHDRIAQRHTLLVAPLWYSRTAPDRAFYAAFPLVWRSRTIGSSTTVVLPFLFDVNRYYQERTTVIFPLGWRRYTAHDRTTRWVTLPSLFIRQRPEATDAFLFPLVWHWGGQQRSTTVVFPLYWDFKRGDERSTVFFPLVWRFRRADADTWVVLNTYYRGGRGRHAGTYRFIFVPLFEVARPRPQDFTWEVLSGLVGYARIGHNRVLRLFWQQIRLDPARTSGGPQPATQRAPGRQSHRSPRRPPSRSGSSLL